MNTAAVAGLDQQAHISVHEGHGHGHRRTVGKNEFRILAELLDEREDVIPSAAVESRTVLPKFINDLQLQSVFCRYDGGERKPYLVHFESSSDCLNENCGTNGSSRNANVVLREIEHIIPQPGFQMGFHLGQIEVGAGATLDQLLRIMEEVETKVEEAAGDWLSIDSEMLLLQVPASCTSNQRRQPSIGPQLVLLVALFEIDLSPNGVIEVDLAVDHVLPRGSTGVC